LLRLWENYLMDHHLDVLSPNDDGMRNSTVDPVCGMAVNPATVKWTAEHDGAVVYFCSRSCRDRFAADPAAFIKSAGAANHAVAGHLASHEQQQAPPASVSRR
jgi:YHS domain-containing protein